LGTAIFSVWGRSPRPRNRHARGGVRRVTSASSTPIRRARRSTCSMDSLSRDRSGSGKFACVCCIAKASAITRSSFRCRGFNRSQSLRFALRFRPSHSSPVPAGRPASGSVELPAAVVPAVIFGFLVRNSILRDPISTRSCRCFSLCPLSSPSPLCEFFYRSRITSQEARIASHQTTVTFSTLPFFLH